MPDLHQYQDDDLFNPETAHESSDVPVRPLWWAVIIFVVFAAVTHFALYGMYKVFVKNERARMDPPQTQVVRPKSADVPQNQPLLQPFPQDGVAPMHSTPVTDLADMRKAEQAKLHTYGWVDKQKGVVHIPIDQAKELFVQRVGQATPPAVAPAASPAPAAAEPAAERPASGRPHTEGAQQ